MSVPSLTRQGAARECAALLRPARVPSPQCRNCGGALLNRFCADCGQPTKQHPPTAGEFVHELVVHAVALERSLWATLIALLAHPGKLTIEYFAGRRQRYIAPLRLYLTVSLLFFAVSGLSGNDVAIDGQGLHFSTESPVAGHAVPGRQHSTVIRTGITAFDRALTHLEALPDAADQHVQDRIRQVLPYGLIALVPILAVYLKLAYWNRKRLYGEHLIVAMHAQTVAFVYALVSTIPVGGTFKSLVLVAFLVQAGLTLRRVYGGRTVPTVARELGLLFAYGVTVVVTLMSVTIGSILITLLKVNS